jgi:hypothetical protein
MNIAIEEKTFNRSINNPRRNFMKNLRLRYGIMGFAALAFLALVLSGNSAVSSAASQNEQAAPASRNGGMIITANDIDASNKLVCPEVIWAPASGGGTWQSKLIMRDGGGGASETTVQGFYYPYGGSQIGPFTLWDSPGSGRSIKYTNILLTIGVAVGENLYGTAGTLYLYTDDGDSKFVAEVETYNGDFGKSFPAMNYTDENSANIGRPMLLQNIEKNATYRTSVGCWNGASGGYTMEVEFSIGDQYNQLLGSRFTKTISSWSFISFDPFAEAGLSGNFDNCYLYADVKSSNPDPYGKGLFWYGSKANNNSNDTAAMFPKMW